MEKLVHIIGFPIISKLIRGETKEDGEMKKSYGCVDNVIQNGCMFVDVICPKCDRFSRLDGSKPSGWRSPSSKLRKPRMAKSNLKKPSGRRTTTRLNAANGVRTTRLSSASKRPPSCTREIIRPPNIKELL